MTRPVAINEVKAKSILSHTDLNSAGGENPCEIPSGVCATKEPSESVTSRKTIV